MKALIIYDDFAGAARAGAALQHATWSANVSADWDIRPWRTDVLRVASAADEALIEAALKEATSVPLCVAERANEIAGIVKSLEPITNPNMRSDLTTASALAHAGITGALANVETNLASLKDQSFIEQVRRRTAAL